MAADANAGVGGTTSAVTSQSPAPSAAPVAVAKEVSRLSRICCIRAHTEDGVLWS